jgi:hypothetical protein
MNIAYCYASGEIGFATSSASTPAGVIVFLKSRKSARTLKKIVALKARQARNRKVLLVPGIPEATDGDAAFKALKVWSAWAFAGGRFDD